MSEGEVEVRCPEPDGCDALNGKLHRDSTRWRLMVTTDAERIGPVDPIPNPDDPMAPRPVHIKIGRRPLVRYREQRLAGDRQATGFDLGSNVEDLARVTLTCRECEQPFRLTDALEWGRKRRSA